jgi:FkbM family methyltransferase
LQRVLAERGVDLVVDVGANIGEFSQTLRRLGYTGPIMSFEPDRRPAARLANAASNDPRWLVRTEALGDEAGRRALHVATESKLSSFLQPTDGGVLLGDLQDTHDEEVDVRRLDDVLDELGVDASRILLKVDTQGWDHRVLRGSEHVLDRVVAILVELVVQPSYVDAPDYLELLAWLRERGFEPSDFDRVLQDENGVLAEIDCLLVRT